MTKTLTEQYSNVVFLKDDPVQQKAYTLAKMKPDYSKMYFEFQFKDGEKARYRMDKDCHDLQQFLDRMNHFHDLEKENKRLQEQLKDAEYILDEMGWADRGLIDEYFEKWGVK